MWEGGGDGTRLCITVLLYEEPAQRCEWLENPSLLPGLMVHVEKLVDAKQLVLGKPEA